MRERLGRHQKTFATVKEKLQPTGFGVTDEDQKNGDLHSPEEYVCLLGCTLLQST
jgi:hypothetical protein